MATELWAIGLVILGTIVGALGPIFLKKSANNFKFNINALIKNKDLIIGTLFYGIPTLLFIPALRGGELSVLYPFVAFTYVWVSLLSVKMLKEKMNALKWTGIMLILVGVSLIGLGS